MMLDRVVVIIDGSESAQFAIGASITLALENHSLLTFCVAVDPELSDDGVGGACFSDMATKMSRRFLDDALALAETRGVHGATGTIVVDEPAHGVIALAREQHAALIMLGVKPHLTALRPFIRTVADEILRETMIPLCVVRRPTTGHVAARILVPIVDDELSSIAVEYATRLAENFHSTLIFCSVDGDGRERSATHALAMAKAYADESAVPSEELLLPSRDGIPNAIVRSAELQRCDLIVMASHVRHGLPRLLEGSVTEAVFSASDVPVVIVRAAAVPA